MCIRDRFIGGQEIQVAVLNNKALGAIELKPKRKFYDYQSKYNPKAKTEHIMPANLKKSKYREFGSAIVKKKKNSTIRESFFLHDPRTY